MKRYRIIRVDFDTRATLLNLVIQEDWEPKVKQLHHENKQNIIEGLKREFGLMDFPAKLKNFIDLGPAPVSVVAFHNKFENQARIAFVMGAYYPALTSACALGERILNNLIRHLREDFRNTPEYKRVYNKESFDDWGMSIETLESWKVLLPEAVSAFKNLSEFRNRSLHFNPETDTNDRADAFKALMLLNQIINNQFGAIGSLPWFLNAKGANFIKKSWEQNPFIREIYLPNCGLVGPSHIMKFINGEWVAKDIEYDSTEITDEEFVKLYENMKER